MAAKQDKTDFRWNGKLAWDVNAVYYDLINVDPVHVPYARTHRNYSFFLKTRLWYAILEDYYDLFTKHMNVDPDKWRATDVKIIWDWNCKREKGTVYIMVINSANTKKRIIRGKIEWWCYVKNSFWWNRLYLDEYSIRWCWDEKFFVTTYAKWEPVEAWVSINNNKWIQINLRNWSLENWYFSHESVEAETEEFSSEIREWDYIVITGSTNTPESWFCWQMRMVTWKDDNWRLMVDVPWSWFAIGDEERWWLNFQIYRDTWEVIWFTARDWVHIIPDDDWNAVLTMCDIWHSYSWDTNIIWTAVNNSKFFFLTDNWWIHYSNYPWVYNQFFINEDMYAWVDKTSIVSFRDFIIAFWKRNISVWAPDEAWTYYFMYPQSSTIWLKSRRAYWEYNWWMVIVSNDNRLLALKIANNIWRYMLEFEDIWEWTRINSKLSWMLETDECFIANDNNELRILVNTKGNPFEDQKNSQTHIYKFNTLFQVWTEDHLENILMQWKEEWLWIWTWWVYIRKWYQDIPWWNQLPNINVTARINAYLIENEGIFKNTSWVIWPTLFTVAKLNRMILTLWYWRYSNWDDTISSKPTWTQIKITSYRQWLWIVQEINSIESNDWVRMISRSYEKEALEWKDAEKKECLIESIPDSLKRYVTDCPNSEHYIQDLVKDSPWCTWEKELMRQDHNVCINDSLYELAPHMPLVLQVWEQQDYSSQIKIEVISTWWDILNFGWIFAELFIAPTALTWADWEYQIKIDSSC